MRLNKASQYSILLALYLTRSGRARLEDVAANLGLSQNFLEQVASKLRRAGVVNSIRGPGGGYTVNPDTTVLQVLNAVGTEPLLTKEETLFLQTGQTEHRAFGNLVGALSFNVSRILNTTIKQVCDALVQQEVEQLEGISANATTN